MKVTIKSKYGDFIVDYPIHRDIIETSQIRIYITSKSTGLKSEYDIRLRDIFLDYNTMIVTENNSFPARFLLQ